MADDHQPLSEAQLRRGLVIHSVVAGGVGALLVTIWALTTRTYFWPMWPMLALGLLLAIHAWTALMVTRPGLVPARLGRDVGIHAGVSIALAIFLTLVWTIVVTTTTVGAYFWPIWPILGLAVALAVHLLVKLVTPGDADLERGTSPISRSSTSA